MNNREVAVQRFTVKKFQNSVGFSAVRSKNLFSYTQLPPADQCTQGIQGIIIDQVPDTPSIIIFVLHDIQSTLSFFVYFSFFVNQ